MTYFDQWLNTFDNRHKNLKIGKFFCNSQSSCNLCKFKELCDKADKLPYVEIGKLLLQEVDENGCQENNQKEGH